MSRPHWPASFELLGLTFTRKGDFAAARSHLDQALAREPSYAWVKEVLLPELKAAENVKRD